MIEHPFAGDRNFMGQFFHTEDGRVEWKLEYIFNDVSFGVCAKGIEADYNSAYTAAENRMNEIKTKGT